MPPPGPGWYQPPTPDKEALHRTLLHAAVAVVVVVGLASLGVYSYYIVTRPLPKGDPAEPNVVFSAAAASGPNEWVITVAGVSQTEDYTSFKAVLLRNGVVQGDFMDPLQETTVGNITFTDLDGGGKLNAGDYFTITTWPGGSYKLSIVWIPSGNERGYERWET